MLSVRIVAIGVLAAVCSGCSFGWIYTDTVEPLCLNMNHTASSGKESTARLKQISIPRVPGARTVWSSNAIGVAAKEGGIEKIHFCDKKRFSVLGGLWGTDAVVVYGE